MIKGGVFLLKFKLSQIASKLIMKKMRKEKKSLRKNLMNS